MSSGTKAQFRFAYIPARHIFVLPHQILHIRKSAALESRVLPRCSGNFIYDLLHISSRQNCQTSFVLHHDTLTKRSRDKFPVMAVQPGIKATQRGQIDRYYNKIRPYQNDKVL